MAVCVPGDMYVRSLLHSPQLELHNLFRTGCLLTARRYFCVEMTTEARSF